jgi:integrase
MVFYVFKPSRSRLWSGRYRLPQDATIKTVALHRTNKSVALRELQLLVEEKERESAGIVGTKAVRDAAQKPLAAHLADFLQSKQSTRDERYLYELKHRVLKLIEECGWQAANDVTPESFENWRSGGTRSAKTNNEYLTSVRAVLNWMVRRGGKGLSTNPLNSLDMLATAGVHVRPRRAFAGEELSRLIASSGERGVVYLVAALTGLRRGELAQITRADLLLESDPARIIARANTTKNGKQARLPLHPAAAAAVRTFVRTRNLSGSDLVFADLLPDMDTFRSDLVRAGIEYIDESGCRADFHALRHTFCTMLQAADVSERCAMDLMRHSDRKLTNSVYTDSKLLPLDEAILKLPSIGAPVTQIDTQEFVLPGSEWSRPVTTANLVVASQAAANEVLSHAVAGGVATCHGVDENARYRVRTCDSYRVKVIARLGRAGFPSGGRVHMGPYGPMLN